MSDSSAELTWHVASHTGRPHSNDWYWGLGGIALVGAIACITFGNFLLAIIITLGAFTVGYLAVQRPREHVISLTSTGIAIDGTVYSYANVRSFWVEHVEKNARLYVSMKGVLVPHFSIYLADNIQGDEVRAFLAQHVQEVEQGPQFGDRVAEIFGLN